MARMGRDGKEDGWVWVVGWGFEMGSVGWEDMDENFEGEEVGNGGFDNGTRNFGAFGRGSGFIWRIYIKIKNNNKKKQKRSFNDFIVC